MPRPDMDTKGKTYLYAHLDQYCTTQKLIIISSPFLRYLSGLTNSRFDIVKLHSFSYLFKSMMFPNNNNCNVWLRISFITWPQKRIIWSSTANSLSFSALFCEKNDPGPDHLKKLIGAFIDLISIGGKNPVKIWPVVWRNSDQELRSSKNEQSLPWPKIYMW